MPACVPQHGSLQSVLSYLSLIWCHVVGLPVHLLGSASKVHVNLCRLCRMVHHMRNMWRGTPSWSTHMKLLAKFMSLRHSSPDVSDGGGLSDAPHNTSLPGLAPLHSSPLLWGNQEHLPLSCMGILAGDTLPGVGSSYTTSASQPCASSQVSLPLLSSQSSLNPQA